MRQQPHRRVVPPLVGLVHAAHGQHPGGERRVASRLSLRRRLAQRARRRRVPPGLHVHERQFAQDLGDQPLAARGPGRGQRTVQHHGAFAIEAADRVHQGGAEGGQHISRARADPWPARLRQPRAAASRPRRRPIPRPGPPSRPAAATWPPRRPAAPPVPPRRPAAPRTRSAGEQTSPSRANSVSHDDRCTAARAGCPAATSVRKNSSCVPSSNGSSAAARPAGSIAASASPVASRLQRRPAELLHRPGRAPAPGQHEPDAEGRAVARLHTLQQRPADLRRGQRTVPQRAHIQPQGAVSQADRIAAQQFRVLAGAAQVSQAPAERPQRVVGLAEQLRGQLAPGQRPFREGNPGEQRPGLLPPRRPGTAARPGPGCAAARAAAPAGSPAARLSPPWPRPAAPAEHAHRPW